MGMGCGVGCGAGCGDGAICPPSERGCGPPPLGEEVDGAEPCWDGGAVGSVWGPCGVSRPQPPISPQKFDPELYKLAMPCLCAIAGALPPDYVDASYSSKTEKKASVDAEGNFDPKPVETLK